jgi:hypothetical protein
MVNMGDDTEISNMCCVHSSKLYFEDIIAYSAREKEQYLILPKKTRKNEELQGVPAETNSLAWAGKYCISQPS